MTRGKPSRPASRGAKRPAARRPSAGRPSAAAEDTDFLFTAHPTDSIDASYVLGRGFQLIGERPRQVLGVLLASAVLSGLLIFGMFSASMFDNAVWQAAGISDVMHPVSLIALLMLWWAASLVLQAPLIGSAIELHTEGRGLFAKMLQRAMSTLPRLLGASALVLLIVGLVMTVALLIQSQVVAVAAMIPWNFFQVVTLGFGSLLVMYLAIKMIAGVSLVVPVILVEDLAVIPAVVRSWALGWRHGFAILWAILLPTLLVEVLLVPAQVMPYPVDIILSLVLTIGLTLYTTTVIPVAYVAIREYGEGLHPGRILGSTSGRR